MIPPPPSPAAAKAFAAAMHRKYVITIHHDLRPHRIRPYTATITHGLFHIGYPTSLTWHARTRDRLIHKCDRWITRNALKQGIASPIVRIEEA
jgi:hypothetical protein